MEKEQKKEAPPFLGEGAKLSNLSYPPGELGGVFWEEKDYQGRVYLTIDDGPNLEFTADGKTRVIDSLLDTLQERGLKAAFFINGKQLLYKTPQEKEELQRVLNRIIQEGHLLGNHSQNHYNLAQGKFADGEEDKAQIAQEFESTEEALADLLGYEYPLILIRPPYAEPGRSATLDEWLRETQRYLISLQLDSYDYAYKEGGPWDKAALLKRLEGLIGPRGGVLLIHELPVTTEILPEILDRLIRGRGYSIEGMADLLIQRYGREPTAL